MASDQIPLAALGRPFALGMLYDARQDRLITDFTLWNRETIDKFSTSTTQNSSDYETTASESIETKASLLKANLSLIAGVLSGLVEVGASANYLNDQKEFKNQSRVILQYKATTAFQRLDMSHRDAKKQQTKHVFKNSLATHVVTGILYGANAVFVFDSEKLESHSLRSMEASMQSLIKKIPKLDPDGNTVRNLREEDKNVMEKVSCKFYGDFILEKNPTTFEEAVDAYRKLPGLLGTNGEKSVPVRVWLTPLKNLDPAADELKADLSDGLLRKTENVLEALRETKMRCNDLMDNDVVKTLPHIYKKLKNFQHLCEKYKKTVQQTLQEKIPLIRGGEDEDSLEKFLDVQKNSPYSQNNLNTWLDNLDREINVIASCLDIMKGIKIIPEETDLDRQVLGMEEALCFVFTSAETKDPFMDQMADYFKDAPTCVTPPAKDQWFYSDEVLENMKQKASMMSETAKSLGTSSRFGFLVAALAVEEFRGATIYHYRSGVLKTREFSKPAVDRVRNITDKQDLIWYSCDLTLDPDTVNGFLILSDGEKKATCGAKQKYPVNEMRFDSYPQVLCREGLTGRHYFEVVWSSENTKELGVGLAYDCIPRKGSKMWGNVGFGCNDVSWYFGVDDSKLLAWHRSSKLWQTPLPTGCNKIGVYLDWPAGTLSFYQVSSDTLTHLYTFENRFTAPLFPGLYIWDKYNFAFFFPV